MSVNVRRMRCAPEDVFRVLEHGWLYPGWVVGASRMRAVAADWPAPGARLAHSFGVWPFLLDDQTVVEACDPGRRLVLRAKGWPIGEARVTIDVKAAGAGTLVRIQEEAVRGPGRLVPQPILDVLLRVRNRETLHRLAYLSEGRAGGAAR
ncbi:SRPBCC family protein [Microbacterium telephonicum]|uniref:Polyketide cyclase/dehydrase/lipid transport protein n=1 Tax=Microbacterium telephonicum TaxID=1714841 RepID=A0A498BSU1_9MICO|nr:SRPBCC family protein [Microbacterium telephonicum]RLK46755.1 polyketide cyclase/dehydrase/lipid transport protein [Microbacterium telephonicum]